MACYAQGLCLPDNERPPRQRDRRRARAARARAIWRKKPETAGRLRGGIEKILDWARTRKLRSGENPARWRGHLDNQLPKKSKIAKVKHHAALPYAKIAAFKTDCRSIKVAVSWQPPGVFPAP